MCDVLLGFVKGGRDSDSIWLGVCLRGGGGIKKWGGLVMGLGGGCRTGQSICSRITHCRTPIWPWEYGCWVLACLLSMCAQSAQLL